MPEGRPRSSRSSSPRSSTAGTWSHKTGCSARWDARRATSASTPASRRERGLVMIAPGQTLENPVTGERFTFTDTAASTGGELLAFDFALRPGGKVPVPHVHPVQTERFEVVAGEVRFRLGLRTFVAQAGDVVEAPPASPTASPTWGRRGADARRGPARAGDGDMFAEVIALAEAGITRGGLPRNLITLASSRGATTRRRTRRCSASASSASCSRRSLASAPAVRAPCGGGARTRLTC